MHKNTAFFGWPMAFGVFAKLMKPKCPRTNNAYPWHNCSHINPRRQVPNIARFSVPTASIFPAGNTLAQNRRGSSPCFSHQARGLFLVNSGQLVLGLGTVKRGRGVSVQLADFCCLFFCSSDRKNAAEPGARKRFVGTLSEGSPPFSKLQLISPLR